MFSHKKYLLISLFILFMVVFTSSFTVFAVSPSSISVNVAPENPTPNENVTITLSSYAANLDSVLISYFVNGKSALSGVGRKSFSVTAPAAGSEIKVVIRIMLPDGQIEKTILIRPNVMVLLWQANDSYVPPFYKGKALPVLDSEIKIVAMPEIKNASGLVNPKNMTYDWKRDYENEQEGSGFGKSSFLYTNDYLEASNNIGVIATTLDQKYSSEANVDVGAFEPEIVFYKNDNILGTIWNMALSNNHRITDSEIIVAMPYFISPKEIRIPDLIFNWSINDNTVDVASYSKNVMPLQVQTGVSGTSKLRLDIENKYKIFQTVSKEINLEF